VVFIVVITVIELASLRIATAATTNWSIVVYWEEEGKDSVHFAMDIVIGAAAAVIIVIEVGYT
jgi:hypothetical protein